MKNLSVVKKAFLAVIIANVIWGAAAPIFKLSLENIPPFTLAFWRFFLGALILLAFLRKKAKIPTTSRKDLFLLIAYALSGITFNIMFFFWGLQRTFSINSPVIASGGPILTYFLALLFLHEKSNSKKLFGMILGTLGILLIVLEPILAAGLDGSLIGNIFLVIATLSAVIQTIIGKQVLPRFDPFAFTFWAFIIGAASFLPSALEEYFTIPNLYQMLDVRGITGIVYGSIFSSVLAYSFFAWGLSKINATDASLFTYIDPVVGTVLGVLLLKEPVTSYFLFGAVFIFIGIFVAEGRLNYHPFRRFHLLDIVPHADNAPPQPHHSNKSKAEILKNIFTRPS
jgi:drug/metabolite transporter (DMT)-like permease